MRGRIDHVGVIVDDLEATREFLERVTGMVLERAADVPAARVRTAFLGYGDGVNVELVEIADAAARAGRLGDGPARVEHVAIEVDDLEAAAAELRTHGVLMQTDVPSVNGPTRSLFSRPETTRGIPLQFFQRGGADPGS